LSAYAELALVVNVIDRADRYGFRCFLKCVFPAFAFSAMGPLLGCVLSVNGSKLVAVVRAFVSAVGVPDNPER
jgi:hypothetical protein